MKNWRYPFQFYINYCKITAFIFSFVCKNRKTVLSAFFHMHQRINPNLPRRCSNHILTACYQTVNPLVWHYAMLELSTTKATSRAHVGEWCNYMLWCDSTRHQTTLTFSHPCTTQRLEKAQQQLRTAAVLCAPNQLRDSSFHGCPVELEKEITGNFWKERRHLCSIVCIRIASSTYGALDFMTSKILVSEHFV